MFKPQPADHYHASNPLFANTLSFALQTYANATSNTQSVTHVNQTVTDSGGTRHSTNLACQLS